MRRRFDYAAFLRGWRELAAENGLDPLTGTETGWWAKPEIWADAGVHHSSTEAAAIRSIAAQARAAQPPRMTTLEAMTLVREVMTEMAAERMTQLILPLREMHARRGVEVITLEGVRLEVRKKTA
jgi:hypothetical protein